jgi:hypothetical protein
MKAIHNGREVEMRRVRRPERAGLGDKVAAVATPIARALGLPCIDPQTKDLRPESGCAKRKAKLNQLGEKLGL